MNRRRFILGGATALAAAQNRRVSLDASDPVASAPPVQWAASQLEEVLHARGLEEFRIIAVSRERARVTMPDVPESLALVPGNGIQVVGTDVRGLVYALCELTDRVRSAPDPRAALQLNRTIVERPANPVRCVMRQFTSELLDKPWFYDREMWPHYLNMLATHRFNRFHLAFGFGYDFLQHVEDSYFLFLYPFLLSLPDYPVRATNLPDTERDRNLETLRFIGEQTVARGIDFQLGIWTHGYRWSNSPRAQNTIEGLTAENHASYCRDALTALLRACPAISSVALRIHGESGVAEGSYDFWRTVFDGVTRCGRKVEIDLHAKGIDETMIDAALATGMPVNLSPKYWAEHFGMPYHQTAIRDLEMLVPGHTGTGLMTLSEGSRIFTRYGYADLLRDDRRYTVRHRVFSGTQRLLLWGDPAAAAAYSRMFQFCGSTGVDLMEPLTCRGRRGSGVAGRRSGYLDERLEPRWDWEKYAYWYRVWGRLLYNPDTPPEVWQRHFPNSPESRALQSALGYASRILPVVTTTHMPSAACDGYWPEIYWNQPLVTEAKPNPYSDTQPPKVFQNVSPLDPQLFSRMSEYAAELLSGERSGKYSPLEVAQWLDDLAGAAEKDLARAGRPAARDLIRTAIDVDMQAALGRFFAAKFRSGVLYSIHERTGDRAALAEALKAYRAARAIWVRLADRAKAVYAADLSASDRFSERGQWKDRVAGIDTDITQMEQRLASANASTNPRVAAAIAEVLKPARRVAARCSHRSPEKFHPSQPVSIELSVAAKPSSVRLYYRHVNQAERYVSQEMEAGERLYRAQIPAAYTDSPYPLQYYFEVRESPQKVWLYPGFAADLLNQPYFVLRRA